MKLIEVITDVAHNDTIVGIAEHFAVDNYWTGVPDSRGLHSVRMIVSDATRQKVLDALQGALGGVENTHILVLPIDAALPRPVISDDQDQAAEKSRATREELYTTIEKGARLDGNYVLLVLLSTIVAAIGLIENNVAVIIGAMVIAPLLGPNIAFALGSALGDSRLMLAALRSILLGLGLAIVLSAAISVFWPTKLISSELLLRTTVNLDGIALALASGAAAVLSLSTGLPSVLVGVMVAVALLPPAATIGLMLGSQHYELAGGASLLLAVNVVSVNLAAKLVLLFKGVRPRTWWEKKKARQSMLLYLFIWLVSLITLATIIYLRTLIKPA